MLKDHRHDEGLIEKKNYLSQKMFYIFNNTESLQRNSYFSLSDLDKQC